MDIFVQLVLQGNHRDAAVSQQVTRGLAEAGLSSHLDGKKGSLSLPTGTYAGIFPTEADETRKAVRAVREQIIDRVSAILEASGFKGIFFLSAAHTWCWGLRPVPRHPHPAATAPAPPAVPAAPVPPAAPSPLVAGPASTAPAPTPVAAQRREIATNLELD